MSHAARTGKPQRAARVSRLVSPHDSDTGNSRSVSAQGRQGVIQFFLQRVTGGLYVEREEIPKRGLRTTQSVAFSDLDSFNRWCDDDPIRFEHPILHRELKREGDELWRAEASTDQQ